LYTIDYIANGRSFIFTEDETNAANDEPNAANLQMGRGLDIAALAECAQI